MKKVFVHLGAGAGDLDYRANFRCGVTEFIKKNYNLGDKIYCVEANSLNIKKLKKTYEKYQNVEIYNLAITNNKSNKIKFFYTDKDAPHFQVASIKEDHVKNQYPNEIVKNFIVDAVTISDLFKLINQTNIDYLSIDLEGIDFEILMSIDFKKNQIKKISIEHLHLTKSQKKVMVNHLAEKGYSYCGFGYDHNNFDFLFVRKKIYWNIILSKIFLPLIKKKKYNILNFFILKN